jgi:hypothetical protein
MGLVSGWPQQNIISGDNATISQTWNLIVNSMDRINDARIPYDLPTANSNSAVGTALRDAGFDPPDSGLLSGRTAPGWDNHLQSVETPGPQSSIEIDSTYNGGSTHATLNADRSPVESISKDTAGNITHTEQWSADGNHVATSFDVSNTQPFQTQSAYLDAMNRVDKVDTLNDDGSKTLADFDQNNSQSWSRQTTETSASDHVDAVQTVDDDGTFSLQTNNPDGTHAVTTSASDGGDPAASVTSHYDAANHLISETTHNDDGTTTLVTHDAAGAETWATQTASFDLGYNLKSEVIQYDDGWMSQRVNDLDGAQSWSAAYSVTNASGQLEWQDVLNDNGGTETGFNHSGVGDWTSYVTNFQNGWQATSETDYYADGTRAEVTYDTTGQNWDSTINWYDAANHLTYQDTFYDNGSAVETGYNVSGVGDWTSYTAIFDTAGNQTHETDFYADGSRAEMTLDTAGQAWDYTANWYDAANHLTYQDTVYDNGSAVETGYNVSGVGDWTSYTAIFDAAGNEAHETDYYTDGTRAETSFDLSGQNWDTQIDWYNPAGQLMLHDLNHDNGTSTETWYDTTGAEWSSWVANYDAAGNQVSETDYWDNGWRSDYVWSGGAYTQYDYMPDGQFYDSYTGTGGDSPEYFLDQTPFDFTGDDGGFFDGGFGGFDDFGFYDGGFGFGDFPVVLDLDGNGVDIALRGASTAAFDMVAFSPGREQTSWVAGNDGLLAIDLGANGQAGADGVIDQAREIVFTRWTNAGTDMAALRAVFDTNQNNRLDAGDTRFNEFRVWRDANRNGVSEAGELLTLAQLGIVFLSLTTSGAALAFADGSGVNGLASYTRTDGSTRLAADATFAPAGDISGDAAHTNALVNVKLGAGGATVSEITERDSAGNLLDHRITTIAANRTDVAADTNGDGRTDRLEASWVDGYGVKTVEQKEFGIDGSLLIEVNAKYESGNSAPVLKTITVHDASDTQIWSTRVSSYDAAGDLTLVTVTNDDGSLALTAHTAEDTVLAGSALDDTLTGDAGNDILYGDLGADTMAGGGGDDSYYVDNAADQVTEGAGGGYDMLVTEVNHSLPANVEQLVLIGTDNLDAAANALDDTLVGNAGNNRITVGPGADRIIGHAGIDTVVFSGNRANYAVLFDSTDTQAFTVTDLRAGSPDGIDTISGVEFFAFADVTVDAFSFATQTVTNPDGTRTVTTTDVTDGLPWTTRVSTYDAANHLTAETFNEDNGSVWTNSYDTGNATWAWKTSNTDGNGNLISKMTSYDDGTHALDGHDNMEVNDWADFTVTFDAGWNIVVQSGIRDDGTALTSAELAAAAETIAWYTHTVDPARDFILS